MFVGLIIMFYIMCAAGRENEERVQVSVEFSMSATPSSRGSSVNCATR